MKDGALADGGVAGQTAEAVANLVDRLSEMGAELTDVVKTTCFLIDMDSFATFNTACDRRGIRNHRPARSTVAVRELPVGAKVEIEAVAFVWSESACSAAGPGRGPPADLFRTPGAS